MEIIDKIRVFIENLERKEFYQYISIFFGIIVLLISFFIYRYYTNINDLQLRLEDVNEMRQIQVRSILKRMDIVKNQRKQVNDILDQEKDFKIAKYFNELLGKHNLFDNKAEESTSVVDLGNNYSEFILNTKFVQMTMQQLCEVLQDIEQKERVYAKSVEITKSKKTPKTIDVNLTIATLQPKTGVIK